MAQSTVIAGGMHPTLAGWDPELVRTSRRFWTLLIFLSTLIAARATISVLGGVWYTVAAFMLGLAGLGICAILKRSGYHALASFGLLISMIAMVAGLTWNSEGLYDAAMLGYPTILVIAGLLLRPRQFAFVFALVVCAIVAVAVGTLLEVRVSVKLGTVTSRLVDVLAIVSACGLAVVVVSRDMQGLLSQLKAEVARVQKSEAELEQRVETRTRDLADLNLQLAATNTQLVSAMASLQQAQAQLVQREKQASLGRMVAGLAHELNTPLGTALTVGSGIGDHARSMRTEFEGGQLKKARLQEFLDRNVEAAEVLQRTLTRANELISDFRLVATDNSAEDPCVFNVGAQFTMWQPHWESLLSGSGIELQINVPDTLVCHGYPEQLGQVIGQLIENAKLHAFDSRAKGTIRIEVAQERDNIVFSVSDDGTGIAAEVLPRIFDPFFTTRMGRLSGLGLTQVYRIVTVEMGGSIEAIALEARGTQFQISLPQS